MCLRDFLDKESFNFGPPTSQDVTVEGICNLLSKNWPGSNFEINKSSADMKADMRAEMMKHATVSAEDEVMCDCPYHEQLEKENEELEKKVLILRKRLEYYKAVVEEKD